MGGVTTRRPRGGNHRLKNAMYTAAFVADQHGPDAAATTDTNEPRHYDRRWCSTRLVTDERKKREKRILVQPFGKSHLVGGASRAGCFLWGHFSGVGL